MTESNGARPPRRYPPHSSPSSSAHPQTRIYRARRSSVPYSAPRTTPQTGYGHSKMGPNSNHPVGHSSPSFGQQRPATYHPSASHAPRPHNPHRAQQHGALDTQRSPSPRPYLGRSSSRRDIPQRGPAGAPATGSPSPMMPRRGKGRGAPMGGRGSAATARTIQKLKQQSTYSLEINEQQQQIMDAIPPLADGDIRVVPVCGVEWVQTNMMFVEYKNEIVVIDAGTGFKTPATPGINYTIPNTTYLKANKHKIKALVITHGHLDHIGAIPYVIEDLGFPPIYAREFGAIMIKKRLEEFPQLEKNVVVEAIDASMGYVPLSEYFKVKFFGLTHSIPDSTGVIVQTPLGGILSTGDVRVENNSGVATDEEIEQYAFLKDEKILLASIDSTGIEKPGWGTSEHEVIKHIDALVKEVPGRLFIGTFASQVERLMAFMAIAKKYNKYIAFEGRSMKTNMGIAKELKLTDFSNVIPLEDIDNYPPNKILVVVTGGQGEEYSALNRIAQGTHKSITLKSDDTIILSSSVIAGNEYAVAQMKNSLYRGSYNVITYNDNMVHASGHGKREELRWVHQQIPYKYFMPVHGEPFMVRMHAKMAIDELHIPRENVAITDNGSIIEIRDNGNTMVKLEEKIPANVTVIDGSYMGPLHKAVMDDRKALSEDGMFVVVVTVDTKTGLLTKSPDIVSRGFIYLRESKDLLNKVRTVIKRSVESYTHNKQYSDFEDLKNIIAEQTSKFLLQATHKEPLVIPVVLGI